MKISACMIAKNEEDNIVQCIKSYQDVVSEIIVVDTGSTDGTVQLAESLGAKVFHFEWEKDFAKAKNYALEKATGDWIIFLDADEYFDLDKSKNIPAIIKKYEKKSITLIGCKIINIDKKTGDVVGTFIQTRIFKNKKTIYYTKSIHERLYSDEKNVKAVYLPQNELVIFHTGYSRDRINEKAERNLTMLLEDKKNNPTDSTIDYFLCDTYISLSKYEECITYGNAFLKNRINMVGLNSKVYQNIIAAMIKAGRDWEEIDDILQKALSEFPNHPMFYMFLSEKYFSDKRYQEALKSYERTLKMQENYSDIEINFLEGKIHEIERPIAYLYNYKNNEKFAIEYYIKALERKKNYLPALRELIKLTEKCDPVDTISMFSTLYDRNSKEDLVTLVEELTKQRSGKLLAYYVALLNKQFGHQDFSMVIMLLTNGKYEEAAKHFYEAYLINYDSTYAKLAIVAAFLNKDKAMLAGLKTLVKPPLKRIIEALSQEHERVVLHNEDLEDFLNIFSEIIKLKNQDSIDYFITLKDNFSENIFGIEAAVANTLREHSCYEKAIEVYEKALVFNDSNDELKKEHKSLYYMIGYCYYKIREPKQALDYFEKALQNGYVENDIREFLSWTLEQTNQRIIKSQAQKLIHRFDQLKSQNLQLLS